MSSANPDHHAHAGPPLITENAPVTERQTFRPMTEQRAREIEAQQRRTNLMRVLWRILGQEK